MELISCMAHQLQRQSLKQGLSTKVFGEVQTQGSKNGKREVRERRMESKHQGMHCQVDHCVMRSQLQQMSQLCLQIAQRNTAWKQSSRERNGEEFYFLALSFPLFELVKIEFLGSEYSCTSGVSSNPFDHPLEDRLHTLCVASSKCRNHSGVRDPGHGFRPGVTGP